jgi:sugar O-acyltransferase (sialic acid O-acetyltransferase NeuD family)
MRASGRPCIVWGATGQAKVVDDILRSEGSFILHLFDNDTGVTSPLKGVGLSHGEKGLQEFVQALASQGLQAQTIDCVAAIGGGHGQARQEMTERMASYGFLPRSVIHGRAIISDTAVLGSAVQVLAGAIIGPGAEVGDYTIVNSGANVDHDCSIGRACHLAPNAALAGEVVLEDHVFVGLNATILPRLRIGRGAIVGAGAVVIRDVPSTKVVIGNPARIMIS